MLKRAIALFIPDCMLSDFTLGYDLIFENPHKIEICSSNRNNVIYQEVNAKSFIKIKERVDISIVSS